MKRLTTSKRVFWKDLEGPYQSFCRYRYDVVTQGMPDYRKGLFIDRKFDGKHFELRGKN